MDRCFPLARPPIPFIAVVALYAPSIRNDLVYDGQLDESIPHFHTATRLHADYANACSGLGQVMARLDRMHEAEQHLRQAVRLREDDSQTRYLLGRVLAARGVAGEAVEFDPQFALEHRGLSALLAVAGRNEEASLHAAKAAELE